jgi:motility quorum-sensing regulator/GCU-specific mRNA interferase toxin
MTEKRAPTYDLEAIKAAFSSEEKLVATTTALRGAAQLGFRRAEIVQTIQSIKRSHLHKSMTSKGDHRIWQDVYYVPSSMGVLYVKFTAGTVAEFLLLSFKEKANG